MSKAYSYTRPDGVTVIEWAPIKTPESKARVDAEAKDCIAKLRQPNFELVERQLLASLRKLGPMPETERQAAIKEMQVKEGKANIANGVRMIQIGESADAAIKHLRSELAAIDPWFADILAAREMDTGTEF